MMTSSFITKFYNKFNVGVLSIVVGFLATMFDDFLGFFMGLMVLVVGIYVVIISKQKLWLIALVIAVTLLLILWRTGMVNFAG